MLVKGSTIFPNLSLISSEDVCSPHLDHGLGKPSTPSFRIRGQCLYQRAGARIGNHYLIRLEQGFPLQQVHVEIVVQNKWCCWIEVHGPLFRFVCRQCILFRALCGEIRSVGWVEGRVLGLRCVEIVESVIKEATMGHPNGVCTAQHNQFVEGDAFSGEEIYDIVERCCRSREANIGSTGSTAVAASSGDFVAG